MTINVIYGWGVLPSVIQIYVQIEKCIRIVYIKMEGGKVRCQVFHYSSPREIQVEESIDIFENSDISKKSGEVDPDRVVIKVQQYVQH